MAGRRLLEQCGREEVERRLGRVRAQGCRLISEKAFLRLLGFAAEAEPGTVTGSELVTKTGLQAGDLEHLALFDAFLRDAEPFTFRDVILGRKYAGLLAGNADWYTIARSINRIGSVESLTSLALEVEGRGIYARFDERLGELDGQFVLPVEAAAAADAETRFALAEEAEARQEFVHAARLYGQCLQADPDDSVAAFNQANCLRAAGRPDEAGKAYMAAIKRDRGFVDAWFNFACLLKERGATAAARRHFQRAIEIDRDYSDAVYNLATLEFEAGSLAEAKRLWERYLELDRNSEWARNAERGIVYVNLHQKKTG